MNRRVTAGSDQPQSWPKSQRRSELTKAPASKQQAVHSVPRNPVFWVLTGIVTATEWFIFQQGAWPAAITLALVAIGALLKYRNEW